MGRGVGSGHRGGCLLRLEGTRALFYPETTQVSLLVPNIPGFNLRTRVARPQHVWPRSAATLDDQAFWCKGNKKGKALVKMCPPQSHAFLTCT